jgi:1-acyl-sn-glycerol-3-phosphate acyltransferase
MFNCPLLREFCLWGGGREVSAASIRHALHSNRSIILVPGGQREMIHIRPVDEYVTYVTRHKGFIRLALECGVPLVPIVSIGEQYSLQNLYLPKIQRWTLKHLGVGFPVFPYGRWYLPIPNRCPLTVIIGEPIQVPYIPHPTVEEVDKYHAEYYEQVRLLFDTYKSEAGFPNSELRYSNE